MSLLTPEFTNSMPSSESLIVDLVKRAQAGEDAAFEELFKCRYAQINSFITYMVGNSKDGCELAQETFLNAWRRLPDLQNTLCFDAWLYQIAKHQAINHIRRKSLIRWIPWGEHEEAAITSHAASMRFEEDVEERTLLRQALTQVSLKYRSCLILQIVHGMPQQEIAALLNISKNSVSNYVSRGLEQLRQAYLLLDNENTMAKGS